jgi:CRP-like cAMP-binding protein
MNISEFTNNPHPFFAGMSREQLETLVPLASLRHFEPDEILFREGEPADRFYLLTDGAVEINTHSGGHRVTVQTLGAGDALGWSWLFPPFRWHFEARAQKLTEAISFPAEVLRQQCETDPAFGFALMRRIAEVLMDRLQATRSKLVQAEKRETHREDPRAFTRP